MSRGRRAGTTSKRGRADVAEYKPDCPPSPPPRKGVDFEGLKCLAWDQLTSQGGSVPLKWALKGATDPGGKFKCLTQKHLLYTGHQGPSIFEALTYFILSIAKWGKLWKCSHFTDEASLPERPSNSPKVIGKEAAKPG